MTKFSISVGPRKSLKSRCVTPKTRCKYEAALREFNRFLLHCNIILFSLSLVQVDLVLEEYVETLYSQGAPRSWASVFLSSFGDAYPLLAAQGARSSSRRALQGWVREARPRRAPPLPHTVVVVWIARCVLQRNLRLAAFFAVLFHCYLRPSEALRIRVCDVDLGTHGVGTIRLPLTKSGQRLMAEEFVTINDGLVLDLVRFAVSGLHSNELLVPISYNDFRRILREFISHDGLAAFGFVPYSFRRGGASFEFGRNGVFDRVLQKGRWNSLKAARLYINEARAASVSLQLPPSINLQYLSSVEMFTNSGVDMVGFGESQLLC